MGSRKVLVSLRDSNKIIHLEDEDEVRDLEIKIRGCFSIDKSASIIIQRFEKEWETFVDIDDNTEIEHMDKFKCALVASFSDDFGFDMLGDVLDQSRKCSIQNVSPASENRDSSPGLSKSSSFSPQSSSSSSSSPSGSVLTNQWPFDYELPKAAFSERLQNTLEEGNYMNWSMKHEFIRCITDSVVKITLYPSSQLQAVASKIVHTYPHLRETMGNGYEGWRQSLRNSLKNFRRKSEEPIVKHKKRKLKSTSSDVNIPSDEVQTLNVDKSSNMTPTSSPSTSGSCKIVNHHLKQGTNWAPKVQDDIDFETAVQELKEEMKETVKDSVKINALMEKTFAHRREFINTCPPVTDIMDMYPALQDKDEVLCEFQRIVQSISKECYETNINSYRDSIFSTVRNLKKKTNIQMLALQQPECELAAILSLPSLFCEEESVLFKVFPVHTEKDSISKETGLSPMLSIIGDFWNPTATYICCERKILLNVDTDFAVLLLIGFFYILNIEYPRKGRNTFSFIEHVLLDIPGGNCPAKVISLVEKLKRLQKDVGETST